MDPHRTGMPPPRQLLRILHIQFHLVYLLVNRFGLAGFARTLQKHITAHYDRTE